MSGWFIMACMSTAIKYSSAVHVYLNSVMLTRLRRIYAPAAILLYFQTSAMQTTLRLQGRNSSA